MGTVSPRGQAGSFWREVVCYSEHSVAPILGGCQVHILDMPLDQRPTSACFGTSCGIFTQVETLFVTVCLGPNSTLHTDRKYGSTPIYSALWPGMPLTNSGDTEFSCVQNFVKRFLPFGKPRDQSVGPTLHTWVRCRRSLSRSCEPMCQHKQLTGPFSPPREAQPSIATLKGMLFYVCGYSFYICCILQLGITICPRK